MSDDDVLQRLGHIQQALTTQVRLIAVSKYASDSHVETLIQAGHQDFAEARPQNLRDRASKFPQANWHMIGPLQKNKAKYVGKFAYMWHSLCDLDTAQAVAASVNDRVLPVLLQVNISGEPQKQGVQPREVPLLLKQLLAVKELRVIGLMGMAAKDVDSRPAFVLLRQCRDEMHDRFLKLDALCMGMSNDWRIAVEEGATMIRVGSEIFGDD